MFTRCQMWFKKISVYINNNFIFLNVFLIFVRNTYNIGGTILFNNVTNDILKISNHFIL